jgi:hypothetical protein
VIMSVWCSTCRHGGPGLQLVLFILGRRYGISIWWLLEQFTTGKVLSLPAITLCPRPNIIILIFWDITPWSLLKVDGRFRGTFRIHLQDRRIRRAKMQRETGSKHMVPEDEGDILLLNVGWLSTDWKALYPIRLNSS